MVKTVELTSDEFYIRVSNKTLAYKVDDVRTVLPEDVSSLSIERDKDYVTLSRSMDSDEDRGRGDLDIRLREVHRHPGGVSSGPGRRRGNPKVHGETGPLAGASCQEPSRKARSIRKETDEQKIHKGSDRFQSE